MSKWYNGEVIIKCDLTNIRKSYEDIGQHFKEVVGFMPGITNVEIVSESDDAIVISNNEGVMSRSNIIVSSEKEKVNVEFDEQYKAGKLITVSTHYLFSFERNEDSVKLKVVLSDVKAKGFMGILYTLFGKRSIGKAVLNSYKIMFEK